MCILYFFGQNSDFYTTVMTRLVSLPHESLPLHHRYVTPGGDPEWNLNERRHTHFNLTAGGCVCVMNFSACERSHVFRPRGASGRGRKGQPITLRGRWEERSVFGSVISWLRQKMKTSGTVFNPVMDVAVRQIVRNNQRRWRRENTFCNVFMVISKKINLILSVCLSAGRRQISRLITEDKIPQRAEES